MNSIKKTVVALSLSTFLVGCTTIPSGKFSSFSDSTAAIDESATTTFQQVRTGVLQNMIVSAPEGRLTPTTFHPSMSVNKEGKEVVPIYDYMEKLSKSFDVVDRYAKALVALAGSGSTADIDKAATSLAASLNTFSKTVPSVTTDEGNAAATLADGVGQWATYAKRKEALIQVLKLGQPALEQISGSIKRETPNFLQYIDGLESNYLAYANEARKEFTQYTEQRFNFDTQTAQQLTTFDNIRVAITKLQQAADKLPAANTDLLNSVNSDDLSIANLKSFVQSAQDLKSFYTSLPTK
ncbi:protein of unknown function [Pararobbsia alpina]|uniref:hypothetical protein n=1 Tax=Pararobbsia alpina TaxID=621374 RepID=UPI0039A513DA